jgi:glycosyltransferase involved in cell wall biosynthesis
MKRYLHWFLRDIMPLVWAKQPMLTAKIAGHGWRKDRFAQLDPRVEIVGQVARLDKLFSSVRLTVAPLRFGAGVKGKVLESFAAALPCVMTEIAAEGLPLLGTLGDLVGRDAASIAELVLKYHQDETANVACGLEAQRLVIQNYSQAQIDDELRAALSGAAANEANCRSMVS